MVTIHFNLQLPQKHHETFSLDNIDIQKSINELKDEISKKINYPKDEIQFIYCGQILNDKKSLSDLELAINSIFYVFEKPQSLSIKDSSSSKIYSDDDCIKIAQTYSTITRAQLNADVRTNILQDLFMEYPELRRDVGAQSIIRDPVLFQSLDKVEVIKKISKTYPVLCEMAEFVVKTAKRELARTHSRDLFKEEQFSSSGSEEENSSNQAEQAGIRTITRDQLVAALRVAGSSSFNSLSNIAQRNSEQADDAAASSSSSAPTTSTPHRITSALFHNALNQALLSATTSLPRQQQQSGGQNQNVDASSSSMDTSEPLPLVSSLSSLQQQIGANLQNEQSRYTNQLQIMREMGLIDDNANLQALILSNGEVEAAVTLVLGELNNLFN